MTLRRASIPSSHLPEVAFSPDEGSGEAKEPAESPRILVVEDDYLVAWEMERALADAGFEVAGIASSANEALELAAAHHPALVVMDVRLSGKRDGIDAALELFGRHGIRCVFATAHHTAEARARAQPASPLAWLPKPYAMPSLVAVVKQALRDLRGEKT